MIMIKGDFVEIKYNLMKKTIVGTYIKEDDEKIYFENINGFFAVTKKKILSGDITLEIIQE